MAFFRDLELYNALVVIIINKKGMKFFLISFLISGMVVGVTSLGKAEVQEKTMDWMQEARNQEIPIEEKIPVQEQRSEKESGMPATEPGRVQKVEIKSFDPFASDRPDVQSTQSQWQQTQPNKNSTSTLSKNTSAHPDEKQVKTEENQASILSFNLMLNWLNRFKSNQGMF